MLIDIFLFLFIFINVWLLYYTDDQQTDVFVIVNNMEETVHVYMCVLRERFVKAE
jgi:hypothetical protein